MPETAKRTLYICYFGLRQPLVQTQVLPYLRELVKGGIEVGLMTFEPDLKSAWSSDQMSFQREQLAAEGIEWHCLPYHKRPSVLATAWDIVAGAFWIRKEINRRQVDALHGRAHVATLMGAVARKLSSRKPKLIFDIRGFMPEEYADAGVWPENGPIFRVAKRAEGWLVKVADGFVVLTDKARQLMFPRESRPLEVIPCCVDFEGRFAGDHSQLRSETRESLGLADRRVFVHLGALGGLYLTEELADLMVAARERDPAVYPMFLTQSDQAHITAELRKRGFGGDDFFIARVLPDEVQTYLAAADVGLSFVKATYATQSRSPTKIPEYLAAGLPVLANSGVGDVDELIREHRVGILVDSFSPQCYEKVLSELDKLGDISEKSRSVARTHFDLRTVGGERYRRLYRNVLRE